MRVVLVNSWALAAEPGAQIRADALRRELAHGLAARGHEVHVVQELRHAASVQDGPVRWHFVPPDPVARFARAALTAFGRDDATVKAPLAHLAAAVAPLKADVVHTFDLVAYAGLEALGRDVRRRGAALVAHFHGGAPARLGPLRRIERAAFATVDRFCFTARAHAEPWLRSGALADDARVVEVFETSSEFTPGDRAEARAATRLRGAPALLHLGRLDRVKDPLTTLAAFRTFAATHPDAHLTFAWTDAPMEAEVRRAAAGLPVTFLERVAPEQVELLLRAADALVQASTREVCGRAVLEAFACGTPSLLTDIPAFHRLTDGGRVGALFPVGDAAALAQAMARLPYAELRGAVTERFRAKLSFPALAAAVDEVYTSLRHR